MPRFLSGGILSDANQWRSMLADLRGRQVRGGLQGVESGEGVLSPPLPHLHPPPHLHLPRIQDWREFPPLVPSQSPERHSKAASFASVPAAFHCQQSWPTASPYPQAR
jgi:hypothetical protein